ncbi:MAG: ATP-binding cassette domain-containing protein [bacterium]|nr:ATP-binding cassette domain-containing protein [bacterium]
MNLTIAGLSKRYGSKAALQDLNLTLEPGIVGLVGPNGSGKTTLLRILATTLAPSTGTINWDGRDVIRDPDRLRREMVYMPQQFAGYPHLTAFEFLVYLAELRGVARGDARRAATQALETMGLAGDAKRQLGAFTPGMLQRLGIGYVVSTDARVVLLDEPTAGLDPFARSLLCDALLRTARERLVVICTHIFDDLELIADRIVALRSGRIAAHATRDAFIERARGRVWEIETDAYPDALDGRVTAQRREGDRSLRLRVVHAFEPQPGARAVTPSLQDACAWLEMHEDGIAC